MPTATESGLKIIEIARKKKGWSETDTAWVKAASTSVETLNSFWRRLPVPQKDFEAICYALELTRWQEIVKNHGKPGYYRKMRTGIADAQILIQTLHDLNIDIETNGYLYVDYNFVVFADIVALLKGQYDLGWRWNDDGYFDMIGSLQDIGKKYQLPHFIDLINISYAFNKVVSDINSHGIEWGLLELKQYAQGIDEYKLIEIFNKLKLVPRLLQLGISKEQISNVFQLNLESISLGTW